jgi:hypothetical protein
MFRDKKKVAVIGNLLFIGPNDTKIRSSLLLALNIGIHYTKTDTFSSLNF